MTSSDVKDSFSLKRTYNIALIVREKLSAAAGEAEHNLRLLVGHANLLDELTEALLDPAFETVPSQTDKLSDTLLGLDGNSDESDCGEEFDDFDMGLSSDDESIDGDEMQDHNIQPSIHPREYQPEAFRPGPRRNAHFIAVKDTMPRIVRMKHCPKLESIDEESTNELPPTAVQAIDAIPVVLQATMQTLQISTAVATMCQQTEAEMASCDLSEPDLAAPQLPPPTNAVATA